MKSIPPFKLIPQPLTEEAARLPKFKWAPENVGMRHQLGGEPSFIQKAESPLCPDCGKAMVFYAQLDSINDEYNPPDCGMIYVFVCFDCYTTCSTIHSYQQNRRSLSEESRRHTYICTFP
jgi:hypothetical protein